MSVSPPGMVLRTPTPGVDVEEVAVVREGGHGVALVRGADRAHTRLRGGRHRRDVLRVAERVAVAGCDGYEEPCVHHRRCPFVHCG